MLRSFAAIRGGEEAGLISSAEWENSFRTRCLLPIYERLSSPLQSAQTKTLCVVTSSCMDRTARDIDSSSVRARLPFLEYASCV